jgi:hypothetical protein
MGARISTSFAAVALLTGALLAGPGPASAQDTAGAAPALADVRWAAWIGCWRSADDPAATGARICVTPADEGVLITTIVGGQKVSDERRVADGKERPVTTSECRGTDSAQWSRRALRVYRTASVECGADGRRTLHTASFFLSGPTWVDVETVQSDGDTNVRVTRLVHAHDQRLPDGTLVAPVAAPSSVTQPRVSQWTVDDVIELSGVLPQDGVQAAISEAPAPFRLNAKALTAMADAGVGDRVIDLMIGVTYPQKFVVQTAGGGGGGGLGGLGYGLGSLAFDPFFAPLIGPAALMNCYSPYGWARATYWSSCAAFDPYYLSYPGYYSGYYDPWHPIWIQTQNGGSGTPVEPAGDGRVINGRGYTQVRPAEPLPVIGGGGSNWSGQGAGGNGGSSGSSGSSGVSSSGYSGGGGGGGGGGGDRVAVPRPPGN